MGGAGAGVQALNTNKANSVNVPNKRKKGGPALRLSFERI